MTYGSLSVKKLDGKSVIVIDMDNDEIELVITRLIPSHHRFPLTVSAHAENSRLLRMILREYPLHIKTQKKWEQLLGEIQKQQDLAKTIQTLKPVDPTPHRFIGKLLPFQKLGLDFLLKTNGIALLADEMGLGKTVQTLAFISQRPDSIPVVVVAPLVTLQNWKREIERFLRLDVPGSLLKHDTPRVEIIRSGKQKLRPAEFYLINYELVSKHVRTLECIHPKLIVFDEIQNLRNPDTKKFEACHALTLYHHIKYRLGLSGTPIYNRGIEMYGIADIIKPGILGDRGEFIRRYCRGYNPNQTTQDKRITLSNVLKRSIMIRRKKIDVLPELPEKNRLQQNIPINVTLYKEGLQKLYQKIESAKKSLEQCITEDETEQGLFELNKQVREMRVAERQIAGLAKVPHIIEYVSSLLRDYEDEKFVVFCHHRSVHQVLFDGLWRFNPVQVIGGQKDDTRQNAIDSFQNNKDCRVIICGLRAGNVGINLTSAAYVIFAELDWSPAIHRQAEDRLHRIGQKRTVFSHYLVGVGTFDEILSGVLVNKTVEISNVLGDKLESLNNKKAIEILEKKFKLKNSLIAKDLHDVNSNE